MIWVLVIVVLILAFAVIAGLKKQKAWG